MIFTRFGSECEIELAWEANKSGRIPVDIIIRGNGAVHSSRKQTYSDELRADGGIEEIMASVKNARVGSA